MFCRIRYPFLWRKACTRHSGEFFPKPIFLAKWKKMLRVATLHSFFISSCARSFFGNFPKLVKNMDMKFNDILLNKSKEAQAPTN